MKLRIRAQRELDGSTECFLTVEFSDGAEVQTPVILDETTDEAILALLDDGHPVTVVATAPLVESVTFTPGRVTDVRGVDAAENTNRA